MYTRLKKTLQYENILTSLFFSHQESDARLMYLSHQRRTTPFFEIFTAAIVLYYEKLSLQSFLSKPF